ncbi:MAG: rhodanese-like domain-containing protein [Flavobacteriaceae bacterium]
MKSLTFSIVILLFTSCLSGQTKFKNISKQDLEEALKLSKIQLVDVRTQAEFDKGFIAGASLINFWEDDFLSKVTQKFDKNKPIYLYCKVGGRSSKAAKILVKEGFKEVYSLEGGYSNWIKTK